MKFIPNTSEDAVFGNNDTTLLGSTPTALGYSVNFLGAGSIKDKHEIFIQPSYDVSLDTSDAAFSTGFMPMWTADQDVVHKKHFKASYWAIPLGIYPFFGPDKHHFLSPTLKKQFIGGAECTANETRDPIEELRTFLYRNVSQDEFKFYTKNRFDNKDAPNKDAPLPSKSSRYALLARSRSERNRVLAPSVEIISGAAYQYLLQQAREVNLADAKSNTPVVDPNYPHYTFGDITKPSGALRCRTALKHIDPSNAAKTANCFVLSEDGQTLDKDWESHLHKFTPDQLDSRFILWDMANWNWLTYQQIVDLMVDQLVEIPLELIKAACGNNADIPESRKAKVRKVETTPPPDEDDETQGIMSGITNPDTLQGSTPPMPPSTPAVPTPPPASTPAVPTPPPAVRITVAVAGGEPFEINETEARNPAYAQHYVLVNNAWKLIHEVYPPLPAVPAVPALPPAPSAPAVPATPAVPTTPAAPVTTSGEVSQAEIEEARSSFVQPEVYNRQTAELRAEIDEVARIIAHNRIHGVSNDAEFSQRLVKVIDSLNY